MKTRGTFGEVQLGALLDQMLSPEQYAANVKTKKNATEFVEFAIKLPGKENSNDTVYFHEICVALTLVREDRVGQTSGLPVVPPGALPGI